MFDSQVMTSKSHDIIGRKDVAFGAFGPTTTAANPESSNQPQKRLRRPGQAAWHL